MVDDQANKGVSIHNSCSSYGGDMIADDNGNLYVFSARNHVFKINIESKVATHLGIISGLPTGFTVNGAAVTDEQQNSSCQCHARQVLYLLLMQKHW